jgi:hypothetical protein
VSWQVGKVVNTLVTEAQKEHPENVVLATIDPLTKSAQRAVAANVSYDDIRVIIGQVVTATKPPMLMPV